MTPKAFSSQMLPSPPQGKLVYSKEMTLLPASKNEIIRPAIPRNYIYEKKKERRGDKKKKNSRMK